MIRHAEIADIFDIVELVRPFYATTSYKNFASFDYATVEDLTLQLIESGVVLVACLNEKVVGVVGLVTAPFMFNKHKLGAYEVIWWIEPEAQGLGMGKELLLAIEPACKAKGVDILVMVHLSNSPPQAAALYGRMGYTHSESCYTKVI